MQCDADKCADVKPKTRILATLWQPKLVDLDPMRDQLAAMSGLLQATHRQRVIHNAAHQVLIPNWVHNADESTATKKCQSITLLWQSQIILLEKMEGIHREYVVAGINERFDLVDTVERTVYELKTSSKNPHHEFYKDVFKVWVHNRNAPQDAFHRFVFLVPNPGADQLNRGLGFQVQRRIDELGFGINVMDVGQTL